MPNHGFLFQDGGLATIDVIGLHKKVEFDKRSDLTFVMGEGRDHNLPPGLETALEKMKRNERAHITLSPKYTFGKEGCPQLGIGPNEQSHLTYEASSFYSPCNFSLKLSTLGIHGGIVVKICITYTIYVRPVSHDE